MLFVGLSVMLTPRDFSMSLWLPDVGHRRTVTIRIYDVWTLRSRSWADCSTYVSVCCTNHLQLMMWPWSYSVVAGVLFVVPAGQQYGTACNYEQVPEHQLHFLLDWPSSSPVMKTLKTMMTRPTNSVMALILSNGR